jgi:transketolase
MVISDNDTKLSGRITKDSFSMQPSFEAMDDLGWDVRKVDHGHDLQAVYLAVEKAVADTKANPAKPVCLWVKTIKGYGVKATVENAAGGHGFPLANGEKIVEFVDEIFSGQTPTEFKDWAQALRTDWEQKEAAKKAKAAVPRPIRLRLPRP